MLRTFLSRALPALLSSLLALGSASAQAADATVEALLATLKERMPALVDAKAVPTPLAGMYEIRYKGGVVYASEDGKFLFGGPLLDLENRVNLTENYEREQRVSALAAMPEDSMIIFEPDGAARYTVTTFTDIDCGYCRKMHSEMAAIRKAGIRVRYLLYPRAGKNSDSYRKAVAVWCADDRNDAITLAKGGQDPGGATCSNPVDAHMELARDLGLRGTPYSITEGGERINGYLPAKRLLERLGEGG